MGFVSVKATHTHNAIKNTCKTRIPQETKGKSEDVCVYILIILLRNLRYFLEKPFEH